MRIFRHPLRIIEKVFGELIFYAVAQVMFELVVTAVKTRGAIDFVFMHQKRGFQLLHALDVRYLLQFTVVPAIMIYVLLQLLFEVVDLLILVIFLLVQSDQLVLPLFLGLLEFDLLVTHLFFQISIFGLEAIDSISELSHFEIARMLLKLLPRQIEVTHIAFDLDERAVFPDVVAAFLQGIKIFFAIWTGVSSFGTTSHQMLEQVPERDLELFLNRGSFDQVFLPLA